MSLQQEIAADDLLGHEEVLRLVPALKHAGLAAPMMAEAAAPDVPRALGWMIVASYALILTGFFVSFAHSPDATMMIVIAALYTAIYLAVPAVFFRVEADRGRPAMRRFLRHGLDTYTGHVGGAQAIAQILLIPLAIASAVFAIGLVAALTR